MIDPYIASIIARLEHEEKIHQLARVNDYDRWLIHEAGNWQFPPFGALLSSLRKGLAALVGRLKRRQEVTQETPVETLSAPEN